MTHSDTSGQIPGAHAPKLSETLQNLWSQNPDLADGSDIMFQDVPNGVMQEYTKQTQIAEANAADDAQHSGVTLDVSDVRLVLILSDQAVKDLVNGLSLAARISRTFAAHTVHISKAIAGGGLTIPAQILVAFITALAAIFSVFCVLSVHLLRALNHGNGVYLTVTIPQLVISAGLIITSILVPITAWITMPLAIAACVIIPTTRPKD